MRRGVLGVVARRGVQSGPKRKLRALWELHKEYMGMRQAAKTASMQIEQELRDRAVPILERRRRVLLGEDVEEIGDPKDEIDIAIDDTLTEMAKIESLDHFWAEVITALLDEHTPNARDALLLKHLIDVRVTSTLRPDETPPCQEVEIEFEFSQNTPLLKSNILKATYLYEVEDLIKCYNVVGLDDLTISKTNFSVFELFQEVPNWDDVTSAKNPEIALQKRHSVQSFVSLLKDGGVAQAMDIFLSQRFRRRANANGSGMIHSDDFSEDDTDDVEALASQIQDTLRNKREPGLISSSPSAPPSQSKRKKRKSKRR